jgi:hypothetical protein
LKKRAILVLALMRIDDPRAVPALREALASTKDSEMYIHIAAYLKHRDSKAAETAKE